MLDLNVNAVTITMYEDNQSAIKFITKSDQKQLKHIDVKFNVVKQNSA